MSTFAGGLFISGVVVVVGALTIGVLLSGDGDGVGPEQSSPPASALDEGVETREPAPEAKVTATPEPPRATSTPRPATPAPEPTLTLEPRASETPGVTETTNFSGLWRVGYAISEGYGAGGSFTFDVALEQDGTSITGGNDEVQISGRVDGETATLIFRQPALGYSARFTWTLVDGAWGGGVFRSAVNAGTSSLQRLR
jgi:hypothetical protein